jgi:hypothetical protein
MNNSRAADSVSATMILSICPHCGMRKKQPFTPCEICGATAESEKIAGQNTEWRDEPGSDGTRSFAA